MDNNQMNGNNNNNNNNNNRNNKNGQMFLAFLLVSLVMLFIMSYVNSKMDQMSSEEITYSRFLKMVEECRDRFVRDQDHSERGEKRHKGK